MNREEDEKAGKKNKKVRVMRWSVILSLSSFLQNMSQQKECHVGNN
jgi:hypothetical protein